MALEREELKYLVSKLASKVAAAEGNHPANDTSMKAESTDSAVFQATVKSVENTAVFFNDSLLIDGSKSQNGQVDIVPSHQTVTTPTEVEKASGMVPEAANYLPNHRLESSTCENAEETSSGYPKCSTGHLIDFSSDLIDISSDPSSAVHNDS